MAGGVLDLDRDRDFDRDFDRDLDLELLWYGKGESGDLERERDRERDLKKQNMKIISEEVDLDERKNETCKDKGLKLLIKASEPDHEALF